MSIEVQLCWVPARMGFKDNEQADKLVKRALKIYDNKVIKGRGEAKSLIGTA